MLLYYYVIVMLSPPKKTLKIRVVCDFIVRLSAPIMRESAPIMRESAVFVKAFGLKKITLRRIVRNYAAKSGRNKKVGDN